MDIVERLQHPQFADVAEKYLMVEAADYITRLRAALAEKEAAIATARREGANEFGQRLIEWVKRKAVIHAPHGYAFYAERAEWLAAAIKSFRAEDSIT